MRVIEKLCPSVVNASHHSDSDSAICLESKLITCGGVRFFFKFPVIKQNQFSTPQFFGEVSKAGFVQRQALPS